MLDENYLHIITEKRLNEMLDARGDALYARGYEYGRIDGRFDAESEGSAQVRRAVDSFMAYKPKTSKGSCGCIWNWDDKFVEEFCAEHDAEQEETASRESWETAA